ncbi:MAG: RNA-dependent RNA polymerase [Fushun diaea subdola tombus-like virus 1]|nr:MAG: RNA-dependent RNA polymerase [Fushun diaea subdola tombus-like virus 1]
MAKTIGPCKQASSRQVLKNKMSRKLRRYQWGAEQYYRRGLDYHDSRISAMQKLELYKVVNLPKKECRGIQYRSPTFNYFLALQLQHAEHNTYSKLRNWDGTNQCLKLTSPYQTAVQLMHMYHSLPGARIYCIDLKRCDAHISPKHLKLEHEFYLKLRPGAKRLQQALRWTVKNIGTTRGGVRYKMNGKRMSGDYVTGFGNTVQTLALLRVVFGTDALYGVNGDNAVVFTRREARIVGVDEFLPYGFTVEMDIVYKYQHIEFCQSKLIMSKYGPLLARNPWKVGQQLFLHAQKLGPVQRRRVLVGKAMCELCSQSGVPYNSELAALILERFHDVPPLHLDDQSYLKLKAGPPVFREIDPLARADMQEAWGLEPGEFPWHDEIAYGLRWAEAVRVKSPKSHDANESSEGTARLAATAAGCDEVDTGQYPYCARCHSEDLARQETVSTRNWPQIGWNVHSPICRGLQQIELGSHRSRSRDRDHLEQYQQWQSDQGGPCVRANS